MRLPLAVLAAFAVLTTACSAESPAEPVGPVGDFGVSPAYDAALLAGASEDQLNTLAMAAETGQVTLEQLKVAVEATLACFDDNGVPHTDVTYDPQPGGLFYPNYMFGPIDGLSSDESLAVADSCISKHSDFLYQAYATQPSSVEAQELVDAAALPRILNCLRVNGIQIPDDATLDEVTQQSMILLLGEDGYRDLLDTQGSDLAVESPAGGSSPTQPSPIGPDCIAEGYGAGE